MSDWSWLPLGALLAAEPSALADGPFGSKLKSEHYTEHGVRVVRLGNIGIGEFKDRDRSFVSETHAATLLRHSVVAGDLLIAALAEPVGRCCEVPPGILPAIVKADCIRFRPHPDLNRRFVMHWLNSPSARKNAERRSHGVGRLRINMAGIRDLPVPVPSRATQDAVVAAIEVEFSRLDAAVASLTRAKGNVKRARASVLKAAVEGRLVPTEAALARAEGRDYEPAVVLLNRIEKPARPNRYKTRSTDVVAGHPALSVGDTLAPLPEGWKRVPLVDVARMESGHTPSRNHPEWWNGDVPWVGIADARNHHGSVIFETLQHTNAAGLANSAARSLPVSTICVSRTASVGYVVVLGRPMATSQDFANWVCTNALSPDWVRIVFMVDREALLRFGKGSVHKTIYFPELLSLHIAVPPLAEQHRIVAEVDRRLSVLDALEATIGANLARCDRLRQAILARAFEGRLVPAEEIDHMSVATKDVAEPR